MLVRQDIHPDDAIYYLGSLVLSFLKKAGDKKIDVRTLYKKLNIRSSNYNLYFLSLDWLFILGLVEGEEGKISLLRSKNEVHG